MKMYKVTEIIDLMQNAIDSDNEYVGFEVSENDNLVITLKTHEPKWRDPDGFGEAVEELELLDNAGEY